MTIPYLRPRRTSRTLLGLALLAGACADPTPQMGIEDATQAHTRDAGALEAAVPSECAPGQNFCNGQCRAESTDACGAQCQRCPSGVDGTAICRNGICTIMCPTQSQTVCGTQCVDLSSDRNNCGVCARTCPSGEVCASGACARPASCSRLQDPICSGATYCNVSSRTCLPGCDGRAGQCRSTERCDTARNECVCATGNLTCAGTCVACPADAFAAETTCQGSACIISRCSDGYTPSANGASCTANGSGSGDFVVNAGLAFGERPAGARAQYAQPVAISADGLTLAACNQGDNGVPGGVYIYQRASASTRFPDSATQFVAEPNGSRLFCRSVALGAGGLGLAVGAVNEVYIYTRTARSGFFNVNVQNIRMPRDSNNLSFGRSLATNDSGQALIVGDAGWGPLQGGAVHVFNRTGNFVFSSTPNQTLQTAGSSQFFGDSVALSADGTTLIVGNHGSVLRYRRQNALVNFAATPAETIAPFVQSTSFGASVALADDSQTLLVADPYGGVGSPGVVYRYGRSSVGQDFGSIAQALIGPVASGGFGSSIALRGDGAELYVVARWTMDGPGVGPGSGVVLAFVR